MAEPTLSHIRSTLPGVYVFYVQSATCQKLAKTETTRGQEGDVWRGVHPTALEVAF